MSAQSAGRQILILGMGLVLAGLVWGLVVPHTPYPRLAMMAHIQFEENGMLSILLGLVLLKVPSRVGSKSIWVILLSVYLAWPMVLSEIANSWWGTSQLMPIAAKQAGATGGARWQEALIKITHIGAGVVMIVACALLIFGFLKKPGGTDSAE